MGMALLRATKKNIERVAEDFITYNLLDYTDGRGNTILHKVTLLERWDISEKILKIRPDLVNHQNNRGLTALHIAVTTLNVTSVNRLLEHDADPHVKTGDGNTSLHLLSPISKVVKIKTKKLCIEIPSEVKTIVDLLIEAHTDLDAQNKLGNTPLHMALIAGSPYAKFLIPNKAINCKNQMGLTVLHLAVMTLNREMTDLLLQKGADQNLPDAEGNIPICLALDRKEVNTLKPLIQNDPSKVNYQNKAGLTPLHIAITKYNEGMINLLIEKGADPNIFDNEGNTAITTAVRVGLCTTAFFLAHSTPGIQKQHDETKLQGTEADMDPDV